MVRHRNTDTHYIKVRGTNPLTLDPVQRAARTIYLNKTCFNGLYRVNGAGLFNVPFGWNPDANFCDDTTLRRASRDLVRARLHCGDYRETLRGARRGDLVYFDPPYLRSTTKPDKTFHEYQARPFGLPEHEELAAVFRDLDTQGCHVALSNSDTPEVRRLYRGYSVTVLAVRRTINANLRRRDGWQEVLIHNM